jgi:hypothetical protein
VILAEGVGKRRQRDEAEFLYARFSRFVPYADVVILASTSVVISIVRTAKKPPYIMLVSYQAENYNKNCQK